MRAYRGILFLTLVVMSFAGVFITTGPSTCLAAKSSHASPLEGEPDVEKKESQNANETDSKYVHETVDIAEPPKTGLRPTKSGYFYRYRQSFTMRTGGMYHWQMPDQSETQTILGIQFSFMTESRSRYEIGADQISGGNGAIHLARKWVFDDSKFRPFSKAGLGLIVEPQNNIASLLKHKNFLIEGSLGFEYLIFDPQSIRVEIEGGLGSETLQALLLLGYVWAW